MQAAEPVAVRDAPERHRYEISVDGAAVGYTEYRQRPGLIAFVHTEIDDAHRREGLGARLIRCALEDARARGQAVLPFCPFVRGFIEQHEDYLDLVPAEHRARFGLAADA